MKLNIEQVISFNPCTDRFPYKDPDYIYKLFNEKEVIEHQDILQIEGVPEKDKRWLLLRMFYSIPENDKNLFYFAYDCVEHLLLSEFIKKQEFDIFSWDMLDIIRHFHNGEMLSREELKKKQNCMPWLERDAKSLVIWIVLKTDEWLNERNDCKRWGDREDVVSWQSKRICHYLEKNDRREESKMRGELKMVEKDKKLLERSRIVYLSTLTRVVDNTPGQLVINECKELNKLLEEGWQINNDDIRPIANATIEQQGDIIQLTTTMFVLHKEEEERQKEDIYFSEEEKKDETCNYSTVISGFHFRYGFHGERLPFISVDDVIKEYNLPEGSKIICVFPEKKDNFLFAEVPNLDADDMVGHQRLIRSIAIIEKYDEPFTNNEFTCIGTVKEGKGFRRVFVLTTHIHEKALDVLKSNLWFWNNGK